MTQPKSRNFRRVRRSRNDKKRWKVAFLFYCYLAAPCVFYFFWASAVRHSEVTVDEVTFAIKSSGRYNNVVRLVESIFANHAHARILIADDGLEPLISKLPQKWRNHVEVIQLPYDTGLSFGRNTLVNLTLTTYFVNLDDDFEFTKATKVMNLVKILKRERVDLVGGPVGDRLDFGYRLERKGSALHQVEPTRLKPLSACGRVDIVANFFVARTQALRAVKWDVDFKLGEHEDFFLSFKQAKYRVLMCRISPVKHNSDTTWIDSPENSLNEYQQRRRRAFEYLQMFLHKHQLQKYITKHGVLIASNVRSTMKSERSSVSLEQSSFKNWVEQVKISVVLISWKRLRNAQRIVSSLPFPSYIGEVVIWNNNPNVELSKKDFTTKHVIHIYNSKVNENTFGRWEACGRMAKYDLCYFIDDDFLPKNIHQLYMSVQRDPTRIHAAGYVGLIWNDHRWTIEDQKLGIHSQFTWLGHGSMINRTLATTFLGHAQRFGLEDAPISDNAFSLWTNRFPVLHYDEPASQGLTNKFAFSKGPILSRLHTARINALNTLVYYADEWYPHRESIDSHPLTSALFKDRSGILLTNMLADTYTYSFKDYRDFRTNWTYIHTVEEARQENLLDDFMYGTKLTAHSAVDSDLSTFWETREPMRTGDMFIIDTMQVGPVGFVRFRAWEGLKDLLVSFSVNFEDWYEYNLIGFSHVAACKTMVGCQIHTYNFTEHHSRYIRFHAAWDSTEVLRIWDIRRWPYTSV